MKRETAFRERYVRPFLKTLKGCKAFPIQQLAMVGDPDFLLCIRGKFVALELKAKGGRVRPLQEHCLNQVRAAGGLALVADPENWPVIKEVLRGLDGSSPR